MVKKTVNVKSNNQSGGVTAGEINIDSPPARNSGDLPKPMTWIAWVLGTIVALITIYTYFWS